ncbi:MAG: hypothetical protein Q7U87_01245, partial [bacterium]|nr:hypothetical protein [bacterium]
QALVFLQPIIQAFLNRREYDEIVLMMEERENVEKLLLEIENQEAQWQQREKTERDEAKKLRSSEGKKTWFQRFKSFIGLR